MKKEHDNRANDNIPVVEQAYAEYEISTSSDPNFWDYIDIARFTKNTGIERDNVVAFILKELIDNACDSVEKWHKRISKLSVTIRIRKDSDNNGKLVISVSNKHDPSIPVFDNLLERFNYKRAFSSKDRQHRQTRGAQGDALKKAGTTPYMLLNGVGYNSRDYPLVIQHNNIVDVVYIDVDRQNGKIIATIDDGGEPREDDSSGDTDIMVTLPPNAVAAEEGADADGIKKLINYCLEYSLFNTHIEFKIYYNGHLIKHLPAEDKKLPSDYRNPNSTWCYSSIEFGDLLNEIYNKKDSMYNVLSLSDFREVKHPSFNYLKNVTVEDYIRPPGGHKNVVKLHKSLNDKMLPMSKLELPYNLRKRKQSLKDRFRRAFPNIDCDYERVSYRHVPPYRPQTRDEECIVRNDDGTQYPYMFECLAIPSKDDNYKSNTVHCGVNYSTTVNSGQYFKGDANAESWTYEWDHKKTGNSLAADTIDNIIRKAMAGEDISNSEAIPASKRKVPCVLIAHLASQKINWIKYGKSSIVLEPFAEKIAQTIEAAILDLPSDARYLGLSKDEVKKADIAITKCLKKLLVERYLDVKKNPLILDWTSEYYDPWSQSTVFYRLRDLYLIPLEQKYGISLIKDTTREYITGMISEICESARDERGKLLIGLPRERLGITANARAVMYYRGALMNVDIDEIPNLALKGTDVIFVEKRGVVDQLRHIADAYAIAFVSTQGHFAEYPKDLITEIVKNDGYVIILTDFDCAGIHIAENVISEVGNEYVTINNNNTAGNNLQIQVADRVKRMGIDMNTLDYFVKNGLTVSTADSEGNPIAVTITSREQLQKYCEESYPKPSKGKKPQPALNVVSPIIDYLRKYMQYEKNPALHKDYRRLEYIAESFEYLTGLPLEKIIRYSIGYLSKKDEQDGIKDLMSKRPTHKAKRIELDSVISVVTAVKFGEYVTDTLIELFPNRNGLRAIDKPVSYFGDKFAWFSDCPNIMGLWKFITDAGDKAVEPINEEINDEFQNIDGLLDINLVEAENEYDRAYTMADDEIIRSIEFMCGILLKRLTQTRSGSGSTVAAVEEISKLLVRGPEAEKQHDNNQNNNRPPSS
ncbi:MAG TPA: toprim domain-containing protein [Nitrososphaeraceae archaeon]|nr:toprim domain-containing protein [Nitrososphaeraceae archaeon]